MSNRGERTLPSGPQRRQRQRKRHARNIRQMGRKKKRDNMLIGEDQVELYFIHLYLAEYSLL